MEVVGFLRSPSIKVGPYFEAHQWRHIITNIRKPLNIVFDPQAKLVGLASGGELLPKELSPQESGTPLLGTIPALYPEWLGDRTFQATHNVRFAYVGGAMARGIASSNLVIALAHCGMLGFFGAAGLKIAEVEQELAKIKAACDPENLSFGANLIHSPDDPTLEEKLVDLYLKHQVQRVCAASFMQITPALVRYCCQGLTQNSSGKICRKNYIFAKVSRPEIALQFLSPAPAAILNHLLTQGAITKQEAELAQHIPIAEDITVESDSGGHTDNRPLNSLFPRIAILRDEVTAQYNYQTAVRLGAAGSLGTPNAIAAAFALGASYVLLGSLHQACIEAGISSTVKQLLATADVADTMMTISADMFELGSKVQVLKKRSMMGIRGNKLYELYRNYNAIEEIPAPIRTNIEQTIFRMPLAAVWERTQEFFAQHDPLQLQEAATNAKHKMALIFKWYLGNSSRWAITNEPGRELDYQIWCGPAIGAFNAWTKGTFLEKAENREVKQVALNLLEGAATVTRAQQLRTYGVAIPNTEFNYKPRPLSI